MVPARRVFSICSSPLRLPPSSACVPGCQTPAPPIARAPPQIQHICQRVAAAFAAFASLTSPFRARRCLRISFWSPRIVYLGCSPVAICLGRL
jgi:hypothetical protein